MISVITICYNCLDDLKETLSSVAVAAQGCGSEIEQIVIDGGSVDGTAEYLKNSPHVHKSISEKDGGIYDAMNKGVAIASMPYVMFINAGDKISQGINFECLFFKLDDECDIYVGRALRDLNKEKIEFKRVELKKLYIRMPFCHQSTIVRRDLLVKVPFDPSRMIAGDYEFFLRAYIGGKSFRYFDDVVAVVDNAGVSNTKKFDSTLERYRIYKHWVGASAPLNDLVYMYMLLRSMLADAILRWRLR